MMNNLEYDHADIFENLESIKKQFQYVIRTVPQNGLLIHPQHDKNIEDVLQRGCWSPVQTFSGLGDEMANWQARHISLDGTQFEIWHNHTCYGVVNWRLLGQHNVNNGLAAVAAAHHVGVNPTVAVNALNQFSGGKRRLEVRGVVRGITVYDDFAHHPTAIASTLQGLRKKVGGARIIPVLQLASNSMKSGAYGCESIANALQDADVIVVLKPHDWDIEPIRRYTRVPVEIYDSVPEIVDRLTPTLRSEDHVLIMSNKGFGGIHHLLLERLGSL